LERFNADIIFLRSDGSCILFTAVHLHKLICHAIILQFGRISFSKRQKRSTLLLIRTFCAVEEDINFCELVSNGHCVKRIFHWAHFQVYTINWIKTLKSILNWKNKIIVLIILKGFWSFSIYFIELILFSFYCRRAFFVPFSFSL